MIFCARARAALPQKKVKVKTPLNLDLSLGLPNHLAVMNENKSPVEVHITKN